MAGAISCLKEAAKAAAVKIPGVASAIQGLGEAEDVVEFGRKAIEQYRRDIEAEQAIIEEAQSEMEQNGCL